MPDAADPAKTEDTKAETMTKDEIRTLVAGIVKTTVKGVLSEALGTGIKAALDAELAPIREQLTKKTEGEKPKGDATGEKKPAGDQPEDPRLVEALAKIDALTKGHEKLATESRDAKKQAKEERERANRNKAFGDLQKTLNGKVKTELVESVAELLRARGHLAHDDDGNAKLKFKIDDEDRELTLEEGVAHYMKTSKEAASFVPPPSGGAGPNKRPPPSNGLGGSALPGSQSLTPTQAVERATGQTIADLLG